jgi:hypothetical protein
VPPVTLPPTPLDPLLDPLLNPLDPLLSHLPLLGL